MAKLIRAGIIGLGSRGFDVYGRWLTEHPEYGSVVAVCDTDTQRMEEFRRIADIDGRNMFTHWHDLLAHADSLGMNAIIIATPDTLHVEPLIEAAKKPIAILVEKPIATGEKELVVLERALSSFKAQIAVGHVMRETPFWRNVHSVVTRKLIGELITVRHEENIGFWHFAHSYVRGNWHRSDTSSPLSLAKTCHDFDMIRWIVGYMPTHISSMGALTHFRSDHAPTRAAERCLDACPYIDTCPYSAPAYYLDALKDNDGWPVALLGHDTSAQGRIHGLMCGPYGRCVYYSDNTVVDHQQTLMQFPSGLTATLEATAFTGENTRTFQITGSHGELSGRMDTGYLKLQVFDKSISVPEDVFNSADVRISTAGPLGHRVFEWYAKPDSSVMADHKGHAGGDDGLMRHFVEAVISDDFDHYISTSLRSSLDSHWMALAAEYARQHQIVVDVEKYRKACIAHRGVPEISKIVC